MRVTDAVVESDLLRSNGREDVRAWWCSQPISGGRTFGPYARLAPASLPPSAVVRGPRNIEPGYSELRLCATRLDSVQQSIDSYGSRRWHPRTAFEWQR